MKAGLKSLILAAVPMAGIGHRSSALGRARLRGACVAGYPLIRTFVYLLFFLLALRAKECPPVPPAAVFCSPIVYIGASPNLNEGTFVEIGSIKLTQAQAGR